MRVRSFSRYSSDMSRDCTRDQAVTNRTIGCASAQTRNAAITTDKEERGDYRGDRRCAIKNTQNHRKRSLRLTGQTDRKNHEQV